MLVTEDGGKLSDLGLARYLTPGVTLTGMASAASVEYLDPALLQGERPSRSTEVFALGATLHRALTGTGLYGELPDSEPLLAIRRVMSANPQIGAGLSEQEADLVAGVPGAGGGAARDGSRGGRAARGPGSAGAGGAELTGRTSATTTAAGRTPRVRPAAVVVSADQPKSLLVGTRHQSTRACRPSWPPSAMTTKPSAENASWVQRITDALLSASM